MITPRAFRPLRNLLVATLFISLFTTACKQSDGGGDNVDPRDQYVGTFDGGYTSIIRIGTRDLDPESGSAAVTISKGNTAKEIYIDILYNDRVKERLTAELEGDRFRVIDKTKDQIVVNSTSIDTEFSADGQFPDAKTFTMATTSQAVSGGTNFSKIGSITGTRK